MKSLLIPILALLASHAQAQAFDPFISPSADAIYQSDRPDLTVLRADSLSYIPGVTRSMEIAPVFGAPGTLQMSIVRAAPGWFIDEMFIRGSGAQPISATLSYGLDRSMNLDWSQVDSIVMMFPFSSPHKLTVYAFTDADDPADNPYSSALAIDVPLQFQSAVVLPLANFSVNNANGQGVRWGDVDRLSFAFNGPVGQISLYGISTVAAPVPEPESWAMWTAGLLFGARVLRRRT